MTALRRKLLLVFVAAPLVATGVILGWIILRTPSRTPLPNPNGYDDFMNAAEALAGDLSTATGLAHDELQGLISSNAESLRLVRLGLTRQCSFPTEVALTNFVLVVTNLGKSRSLAQLLRAEGRLAEMENRSFDAARCYIDAMRLGNEISRGGVVINRLIGIAVETIGATPLSKLLPQITSGDSASLLHQLEELDAHRVSFDEIRENERSLARHELLKERNPIKWVTGWWQARGITEHTETRHKVVVAHERLLTAELAARCYNLRNARPPARLEDLTTNYLSIVPADPFSSLPLIYRPLGTNWLLYSVGPDGIDDGGKPVTKGVSSKGDIFFDSPW